MIKTKQNNLFKSVLAVSQTRYKAGNSIYSVLFLLYIPIYCVAQPLVRLRAKSMRGDKIKQAVVGQPFTIEVCIREMGQAAEPDIDGIKQLHILGRMQSIHMINGRTTVMYRYTAQADQTGAYTIGPAHVSSNGTIYNSEPITITILDSSSVVRSHARDGSGQKRADPKCAAVDTVYAHLQSEKSQIFVGQLFDYTLRFYYRQSKTEVMHLYTPPLPDGLRLESDVISQKGTEQMNGQTYHYVQWTWRAYASAPGTVVIPAHAVDYTVKKRRQSALSIFFGGTKRKRVYSGQLSIPIDPLPAHEKPVHAIGTCHEVRLSLSADKIEAGKAMVVTLVAVSHEPMRVQERPQLQEIHESIKVYPSKQQMQEIDGEYRYTFEYILQATQPGVYEIRGQPFTYFDLEKKCYYTQYSNSVSCTVESSPTPALDNNQEDFIKNVTPSEDLSHAESVRHDAQDVLHTLAPLEADVGYDQSEIAWSWVVLLFSLLTILWFIGICWFPLHYMIDRLMRIWRYRYAFAHARRAIEQAQKAGSYHELYPIFIDLYHARTGIPKSPRSSELLCELPTACAWQPDEQIEWQQFVMKMAQWVFGNRAEPYEPDHQIFEHAHYWLEKLQEVL